MSLWIEMLTNTEPSLPVPCNMNLRDIMNDERMIIVLIHS